jgi:hypothetical protein
VNIGKKGDILLLEIMICSYFTAIEKRLNNYIQM